MTKSEIFLYLVIFVIVSDTHLTNHDITVFAPYNLFLFELFMRLTVRSFLILTFFIPKKISFCEEKYQILPSSGKFEIYVFRECFDPLGSVFYNVSACRADKSLFFLRFFIAFVDYLLNATFLRV